MVHDFNSSIQTDWKMYEADILVNSAHTAMLAECGIISEADYTAITKGLEDIYADIESGKLKLDKSAEDIHMFIEAELTRRIGEPGKKLHTARSRNDQVATDLRIYLHTKLHSVHKLLTELCQQLSKLARRNIKTIMPGYTHLQRAQPVMFAEHIIAYSRMFSRDMERLCFADSLTMKDCPLGACALAGTTFPIDRKMTAEVLGFKYDEDRESTIDDVSDRDFCIDAVSAFSIIMMHLSRFSEEIILWCSSEFDFIELGDEFITGSSIMPQKRNPDIAELIRGRSARMFGELQTLLVIMKALPLAYNKDMQETKVSVMNSVDIVITCLCVFVRMVASIKVKSDNMREAASKGFLNATDCADYLVNKGIAFRDAYNIVKRIIKFCIKSKEGYVLENLPIEKYKEFCAEFDDDIYDEIKLEKCIGRRGNFNNEE